MLGMRLLGGVVIVSVAIACGAPTEQPGARPTRLSGQATEAGRPPAGDDPSEPTAAGPAPVVSAPTWERLAQAPDAGPPLTTNEFIGDVVVKDGALIAFGLAQNDPAAWRTTDLGASWSRVTGLEGFRGYIPAATVLEDGTVLAVGVGELIEPEDEYEAGAATRVWISADGNSFELAAMDDVIDYPVAVAGTSEAAVIVMHDRGPWRSVDGGRLWEQPVDETGFPVDLGDLAGADGVVSLPDGSLVAVTERDGGMRFVSHDGGQTWEGSPARNLHPPAEADGYHFFERVRALPDGTIIAAGTSHLGTPVDEESLILRSTDQGATWAGDDLTDAGHAVGAGNQAVYDVVPVAGGLLAIGRWADGDEEGPGAWWSPDGGPTWTAIHPPTELAFQPFEGEDPLFAELIAAGEVDGTVLVLGTQTFFDAPTDYTDVTAWRLTLPTQ